LFFALTVAALTTLALGLTLPAHPARAQNPTPAPTPTLYWYEDCAVNSSACGERVAREFGFLPFVLGARRGGRPAFYAFTDCHRSRDGLAFPRARHDSRR